MLDATLTIKSDEGVSQYHAHSFADDFQDILIQFEDQFLYGDSKDNETDSEE